MATKTLAGYIPLSENPYGMNPQGSNQLESPPLPFTAQQTLKKVNRVYERSVVFLDPHPSRMKASVTQDVVGDGRGVFETAFYDIHAQSPSGVMGAQDASICLNTCVYGPVGAIQSYKIWEEMQECSRRGDTEGVERKKLELQQMGSLAVGGFLMCAVRPLTWLQNMSLARPDTFSCSASTSGALSSLSTLTGYSFMTFYALQAFTFLRNIFEASSLSSDLYDPDRGKRIEYMEQMSDKVSVEEVCSGWNMNEARGELKRIAKSQLDLWLQATVKEMKQEKVESTELSEDVKERWMKEYFSNRGKEGIRQDVDRLLGEGVWEECVGKTKTASGEEDLEAAFGLVLKVLFVNEAKEKKMREFLGKMEDGREVLDILKHSVGSDDERVELVKTALSDYKWKQWKVILPIFGLLSLVVKGTIAPIFYMLSCIGWLIVDSQGFWNWYEKGEVGPWDKTIAYISLGLAALSILALCITTFPFGGPLWLLIVGLVIQGIWIGMNVAMLRRISTLEKKLPSISSFLQKPTVETYNRYLNLTEEERALVTLTEQERVCIGLKAGKTDQERESSTPLTDEVLCKLLYKLPSQDMLCIWYVSFYNKVKKSFLQNKEEILEAFLRVQTQTEMDALLSQFPQIQGERITGEDSYAVVVERLKRFTSSWLSILQYEKKKALEQFSSMLKGVQEAIVAEDKKKQEAEDKIWNAINSEEDEIEFECEAEPAT